MAGLLSDARPLRYSEANALVDQPACQIARYCDIDSLINCDANAHGIDKETWVPFQYKDRVIHYKDKSAVRRLIFIM